MNTRLLVPVLALALCGGCATASGAPREPPEWVRRGGNSIRYPPSEYLTGFGASPAEGPINAPEKLEFARNMALARLTAGLQVHIQAETLVNQFSTMVGKKEELVDEFKSKVSARSDIRLEGLMFEESPGGKGEPSYALAYLEKDSAREHYRGKLKGGMQRLLALQEQGNRHLAGRDTVAARATYGECERLIGEVEQVVMILGLLDVSKAITDEDLRALLDVKSKSREVWEAETRTMEEAAELLALKLATQANPPRGKIQVNALMLEDWFQYSQFSAAFRTLLEGAVAFRTAMRPINLDKANFTPGSAGKQRLGVAEGAELLLTGNYFLKPDAKNPDSVTCLVRVNDVKTGAVVAAAGVRLAMSALGAMEVKPRNYLQMLEDQRVFQKDELIGGGLNLEVWTSVGAENLLLEEGDSFKVFVRANKPCFVRFLYHLNNGARIVPDPRFVNFPIRTEQVNKVVELEEFEVCQPFGAEIMQFFAYTDEQPGLAVVRQVVEGQPYDVVTDWRGIRQKIQAPEKTEKRINVTTVAKGKGK
jgi:hypothetical protein